MKTSVKVEAEARWHTTAQLLDAEYTAEGDKRWCMRQERMMAVGKDGNGERDGGDETERRKRRRPTAAPSRT